MEDSIKNYPDIAMIILTKDKNNLIKDLLESIKSKTLYPKDKLTLYIADTGSNKKNLEELEAVINDFNSVFKTILLKYDYYNFAKINNDVVTNYISKDTDVLLFSNNDIRLINDAISTMASLIDENTGTVGARLLYENNTIQHCGILFLTQDGKSGFLHAFHGTKNEDLKNIPPVLNLPLGNTGAFLMVDKNKFNEVGGFNESYKICFEDVELNFMLWLKGYTNKTSTNSMCYHLESVTRGSKIDKNDLKKIMTAVTKSPKVIKILKDKDGFLI